MPRKVHIMLSMRTREDGQGYDALVSAEGFRDRDTAKGFMLAIKDFIEERGLDEMKPAITADTEVAGRG